MTPIGNKLRVAAVVIGLAWAVPVAIAAITDDDDGAPRTEAVAGSNRLVPAEAVDFWAERVADQPVDYISRTYLAASQIRLARESGVGEYYLEAAASARSALEINDDYSPAISALGAAQLAQHDFIGARDLALDALAIDDESESALALLGDASFEIGDVDVARDSYNKLLEQGSAAAVTSRLARVAARDEGPERGLELAERALEEALSSGGSAGDEAFYRIQLASYRFALGDLAGTAEVIDEVLTDAPDQPLALMWRGRVLAAQGDLTGAVEAYEAGLAAQRHPEFVAELADVLDALGDTDAAEVLIVEAIETAGAGALDADGPLAGAENRHLVHILADHGLETGRAVELSRAELADVRQDAAGYDALAWALFADGRVDEAAAAMDQAIALGANGPEELYHAASIAAAQGDVERASELVAAALDQNPYFDLRHSARAEALLTDAARQAE